METSKRLQTILTKIASAKQDRFAETPISAAVMVFLMQDAADKLFFIITKRPEFIATYAGDYCFPGGSRDPSDDDLQQTAIREIQEELLLTPQQYQIIQPLSDFEDRHHNLVRPYLAIITQETFENYVQAAPEEVEKIYYFPLDDLHTIERDKKLEQATGITPTYSYLKEDVFIWGLTARILVHLGNMLFDLDRPIYRRPTAWPEDSGK